MANSRKTTKPYSSKYADLAAIAVENARLYEELRFQR